MPVPDKQPPTAIQIERQVERFLAERIPAGWSLQARRNEALAGRYQVDLLAEIASHASATITRHPDGDSRRAPRCGRRGKMHDARLIATAGRADEVTHADADETRDSRRTDPRRAPHQR